MQNEFGPVHLRIEGDVARGRNYIRAAQQLRLSLLRVQESDEVPQGGIARVLDDGVYAYVRNYGDLQVVSIVADPIEIAGATQAADQSGLLYPDFLSGTVYFGNIENGRLRSFLPTARTSRLFNLPSSEQEIERLAVKPHTLLADSLLSQDPLAARNESQYTRLKPSMYSGTMKKLVQLLLGYGKLSDRVSIYSTSQEEQQSGTVAESSYLQEVAALGTQVRYDWRFHRTHGLARASDGKWWVVQVYMGFGVHAMPLPLYAHTTTPEFRQSVEDAGDDDAIEVLDLFGGFPTGEAFPTSSLLGSYARAGLILAGDQDNRLGDFYQHSAYGPWIGWAFNESGTEAHNTGFRVDQDGFQTGVHWSISIQIGDSRPKPEDWMDLRRRLKASLSSVASFNSGNPQLARLLPVLLQKAEWCSYDQLVEFLFLDTPERFLEFDQIQVDPIASYSVDVGEVSSSRMHIPVSMRNQIQCKFYEPTLGLISHDFVGFGENPPPETDATMFVFFRGSSLCALKAWIRTDGPNTVETSEIGECEFDYFNVTITSSFNGDATGMYSNDIDERQVSYEIESGFESTGTVRDTGQITISDDILRPNLSTIRRIWQTRIVSRRSIGGGIGNLIASACPRDMREAYFMAQLRYENGSSTTNTIKVGSRGSSVGYVTWRSLVTGPNAEHPGGCGRTRFRSVWTSFTAEDGPCALGGAWASVCDNADQMAIYEGNEPPDEVTTVTRPASSKLTVWFVAANLDGPFVTRYTEQPTTFDTDWFVKSPTDDGVFHRIHAHGNEFGSATTIRHSITINGGFAIYGSPSRPEMFNRNWVYIGVMNA